MKFELDESESQRADIWCEVHEKEHHAGKTPYGGAIGGVYSYVVTSTSVGMFVRIECNICRRKTPPIQHSFDLTDVTDW